MHFALEIYEHEVHKEHGFKLKLIMLNLKIGD